MFACACLVMNKSIASFILASLCLLTVSTTVPAQVSSGNTSGHSADTPSSAEAASLQKKANEIQARIRGNEDESGQLKRAVKLNDVPAAKEILLRNGFTSKDLENAKINLRTGGGKGGEDTIEISVTCCEPKEITIQRTLEHFTK
jgi:hypothetical protein